MDQLEALAEEIQEGFEQVNAARDQAYQRSRKLISLCARSIRAMHRSEWETADALLVELGEEKETMVAGVDGYPQLYYAGYTQDAIKEYVEAHLTYAIIRQRPLPTPKELGAENNTWLNGLAEAATEQRRGQPERSLLQSGQATRRDQARQQRQSESQSRRDHRDGPGVRLEEGAGLPARFNSPALRRGNTARAQARERPLGL